LLFSLCASGVYVLNDFVDLDADRHPPQKRARPFASGQLRSRGLFPRAGNLGLSAVIAALLSWKFFAVLALYCC